MSLRAVYKDAQGRTFTAAVEQRGDGWVMLTSDGPMPITDSFVDDVGGPLTFDSYREESDSVIHVTPGGSWADHKAAYTQQILAQEQKQRQAARDDAQTSSLNTRAAKMAEAARTHAVEVAQACRPNGPGAALIIQK